MSPGGGERQQLRRMLEEFVSGRDRSMRHVGQIEDLLLQSFYDTELYDDVLGAPVASYRPGGGPGLYDEEQLARVFRDALHDLGSGED